MATQLSWAPPRRFSSLLEETAGQAGGQDRRDCSFASDLNLDQIVGAITRDREEHGLLTALFYQQVRHAATLSYRHEVFRDLQDPGLFERATHFSERMRQARIQLDQLTKMACQYQQEGWFLDAAAIYCDAVRSLADDLASRQLTSRGLLAFRDYLAAYIASGPFTGLASDTRERKDDLAKITYLVRIKGGRVDVSRYDGEADYTDEVERTFDRFKQGAVKDYRIKYRAWPGMNHVGAQILDLVARLFSDEFSALDDYWRRHAGFLDATIRQFERELQFYLAYLDYIEPLRSAGLSFCFPELSEDSKEVSASQTFDLALASMLVADGRAVVSNDFRLSGPERIIVVSGPNQGGKTTFARTFGQLHHLASVGCPVPGSTARLFLFDQLFTHFEREEDLASLSGRLEDDLLRIQGVLQAATPRSIVIMNEIFTATTLSDALFLGTKVLEKVMALDLLCVYVTFVDELASLGESVVSMASTIVPENPAERTYKVVRRPADGLAYALAIAEKHHLTYELLSGRIAR
ncbi:MAG: DNA mismatch repair protein MutS [Actinomycetota bacterium]|nr:DNA mismatch repair protein MutS [Actinomycetota bacterium]